MTDPSHNPFAPPEFDAGPPLDAPTESGDGVVRVRGNRIYVPRNALLPGRCVRCNAPASRRMTQVLVWHAPVLYLLVCVTWILYVLVALIVRKSMLLELPVCELHGTLRARARTLAVVTPQVAIGLFIAGTDFSRIPAPLFWSGFILVVVVPLVALYTTALIRVVKIDDQGGTFHVGTPYAASLPDRQ